MAKGLDQLTAILMSMRQQLDSTHSRSDVLRPLAWLLVTVLTALVLLTATGRAPPWLLILLAVLAGLSFFANLFAYGFFMFTDPSALRSEKFALTKLAVEHRLLGDSLSGMDEELPLVGGSELPPTTDRGDPLAIEDKSS